MEYELIHVSKSPRDLVQQLVNYASTNINLKTDIGLKIGTINHIVNQYNHNHV